MQMHPHLISKPQMQLEWLQATIRWPDWWHDNIDHKCTICALAGSRQCNSCSTLRGSASSTSRMMGWRMRWRTHWRWRWWGQCLRIAKFRRRCLRSAVLLGGVGILQWRCLRFASPWTWIRSCWRDWWPDWTGWRAMGPNYQLVAQTMWFNRSIGPIRSIIMWHTVPRSAGCGLHWYKLKWPPQIKDSEPVTHPDVHTNTNRQAQITCTDRKAVSCHCENQHLHEARNALFQSPN